MKQETEQELIKQLTRIADALEHLEHGITIQNIR